MAFDVNKWRKKAGITDEIVKNVANTNRYGYGASETPTSKQKDLTISGNSTSTSNALAANNPAYVAAQKYGDGKTGAAANKAVKGTSKQSTDRKPGQINALGAGTYNKTKVDSTLNAAVYNTAGTLANLWGLLSEKDAQTKARDEADSARLKAGYDAMLKGEDISTRPGGIKKQSEDSQKDYAKRYAALAGAGQKYIDAADTLMQRSAEEQEEAKQGLGKFGQGLVDFGIAGAQFAGDIAANAILPGLGTVAMGARAAGGGAYEARQAGLDLDKQLSAAAKSSAIEVITNKLFGAGSKIAYGSGIIKNQNFVNGLVNSMAKTDKGRTALKVLTAANEEGLEEVLSDVLNPVADRILSLQDSEGNYLSSWDAEQMLEDYIIGAALGAFGAGANVVSGEYKAENAQQRAYEDYQKALVNAGLAAEQGSNAQVTAAEYQKILDQSKQWGNRNLSDKETENMLNLLHIEQDAPDVSARLQSLGQSADTETVNAIVKAVNGEKLSRKEQQAFKANPYSQRVVNEMTDTEGATSNGWYADRVSGAAYTPQSTGISAETAQQALDTARRQRAVAGAATFNPTASAQGVNAVAAARSAAEQATVQRVAAVQNVTESIASDINVAPAVVQQVYNLKADTSPEVFKAAFETAYAKGEQGAKETALSNIKALSPQQASIAYNIGMEKAAAAANTQEVNENGVHLRGSGQRLDGQNTAGQVSELAESTGRNTSGQAQGQSRNGAQAARNDGQEVVYKGAKQKGVRYTTGKKTESMRKAEKTAKSHGYSTVFFEGGNIQVDGGEARGIIDPEAKTVYVRTDHPDFTANQIMRHEMGHADIAEGKISLDKVREDLHERFTDAELDEIAQAYADAYEGANMTIEEAFEEICCDALGDMNVFAGTGRVDDARYSQLLTSAKKSAERQANQGRAPPKSKDVKYSRDKYWRPQLNKNEWSLLNRALDNELATSDNYIDNETKWLYKNSKGTKVFAIYGIGDGTDATVLYAVGGERASEAIIAFDREGENFAQYNGEKPSEWVERIWRKSEEQSDNNGNDVRRARDGRDGGLYDRTSQRNGRTTASESVRDSKPRVKEKFSMEKPIEKKKNLIALHNLDETKLLKTLKLGGFPMPSIAITKSDIPHTNFGDITVVFGKETVDPKFDKRNTVYSADAWTPLFPRIEYEANPDAEARIRDKYYKLAGKYGYELMKPMYSSANYVDDVLNNYGGEQGVIEHFVDDTGMMQVFLADTTGKTVDNIKTEHVTRLSDNQREEYDALIDNLGEDVIKELIAKAGQSPMAARRAWLDKHGGELKAAYRQYLIKAGLSEETADDVIKDMNVGSLMPKVIGARNYLKNGAETRREEVDISATKDAIRNAVDMQKYRAWLKELYGGVEKSSGVYNQKEFYTASGNRRSFKQTHFPATLEGIVKAMAAQGDGNSRNVMGFHGVKSLRAGTAERFKSIEDMHKLEGRLKHLTQEEADEIADALDNRLSTLMREIYNNAQHSSYDNELIGLNALGEVLVEAAQLKYKSPANIKALFKKYGNTLSDEQAQDVVELLFDINQMPVNIYEAKPERAVGFDEIRAVIIPDTASNELRSELKTVGVSNVMEYEHGNDAQRMKLANSVEDVHFSLESKQLTELRRENRELKERVEFWRGQTQRTTAKSVRNGDINRLANEIINMSETDLKAKDIAPELTALGNYILNENELRFTDVSTMARRIAVNVIENATAIENTEDVQVHDALKSYLKQHKFKYDGSAEFDAIRDRYKRRIMFAKKGLDVDTAYEELRGMFGEAYFPENNVNPADQLERIAQVLDNTAPRYVNPNDVYFNDAVTYLRNYIVDSILSDQIRQTAPTYADRADAKLAKANADKAQLAAEVRARGKAMTQLRKQSEKNAKAANRQEKKADKMAEKLAKTTADKAQLAAEVKARGKELVQLREQNEKRVKEAIRQEKKHAQQELKQFKEDVRQRDANRRETAERNKYKAQISKNLKTLNDWLLKPDHKNALKHIPGPLQSTVRDFIASIDFTSASKLKGKGAVQKDMKYLENLERLHNYITDQNTGEERYSGYFDLPPTFEADLSKFINKVNALARANSGVYTVNNMDSAQLKQLSDIVKTIKKTITDMNKMYQNATFQHAYEAGAADVENLQKIAKAKAFTSNVVTSKLDRRLMWTEARPAHAFQRFGKGGESIYREFTEGQSTMAFLTKEIIDFTDKLYKDNKVDVKAWEKQKHTFDFDGDKITLTTPQLMGLYELNKRPQAKQHLDAGGFKVANFKDGLKIQSDKASKGHVLTEQQLNEMFKELTDAQKKVADEMQRFMADRGGEWGNYVSVKRFDVEILKDKHYYPIKVDTTETDSREVEKVENASLYKLLNMSFMKELSPKANQAIVVYDIFDVFANHMAEMAQYRSFALPVLDSMKWLNYKERNANGTVKVSLREEMGRAFGTDQSGKSFAEDFVKGVLQAYNGAEARGDNSLNARMLNRMNRQAVAFNTRVMIQQPSAIARAALYLDVKDLAAGLKNYTVVAAKESIEEMHKYSGIAVWKDLGFYDVNVSRGVQELIKNSQNVVSKINNIGMKGAEWADKLTWAAMWDASKAKVKRETGLTEQDTEFFPKVVELFEDTIYNTQVVDTVMTKSAFSRDKSFGTRLLSSFMSEPMTTASLVTNQVFKMQVQRAAGEKLTGSDYKQLGKVCAVVAIAAVVNSALASLADAWRDDDEYATFGQKWERAFKTKLADEMMPLSYTPFGSLVWNTYKIWLDKADKKYFGLDVYGNETNIPWADMVDNLNKAMEIFKEIEEKGDDARYTKYGGYYKIAQILSQLAGIPVSNVVREAVTAYNNFAENKIRSYEPSPENAIKYAWNDGYLSDEEAMEWLQNDEAMGDDAISEDEAYLKLEQWKANESSAYFKVYDAIDDGGNVKEAVDELLDHGKEDWRVKSTVANHYKEKYIKGTEAERAEIRKGLYATGLYDSVDEVLEKCRGWLKEK